MNCPAWLSAALIVAALTAPTENEQPQAQHSGKYQVAAGKTYNIQAHAHTRLLQKYAALGEKVPAEVVREHVSAIRFNTESARKSYSRLAKVDAGNADLAKRVEQMQARLDKVSAALERMEGEVSGNHANSQAVIANAKEISQRLNENHRDLRRIDNDFYDSTSDAYYVTGEGHFVD